MSVDHRLAATTALYYADEYRDPEETGSSQRQQLAEAQVHATLALVEEQRTASLVAFHATCTARGAVPNGNDLGMQKLDQQVRERLGLNA